MDTRQACWIRSFPICSACHRHCACGVFRGSVTPETRIVKRKKREKKRKKRQFFQHWQEPLHTGSTWQKHPVGGVSVLIKSAQRFSLKGLRRGPDRLLSWSRCSISSSFDFINKPRRCQGTEIRAEIRFRIEFVERDHTRGGGGIHGLTNGSCSLVPAASFCAKEAVKICTCFLRLQ